MSKKLTISEIESGVAYIANVIFNGYSPNDLKCTPKKYYKIIKELNEIEKVLQEARSWKNTW